MISERGRWGDRSVDIEIGQLTVRDSSPYFSNAGHLQAVIICTLRIGHHAGHIGCPLWSTLHVASFTVLRKGCEIAAHFRGEVYWNSSKHNFFLSADLPGQKRGISYLLWLWKGWSVHLHPPGLCQAPLFPFNLIMCEQVENAIILGPSRVYKCKCKQTLFDPCIWILCTFIFSTQF